MERLYKGNFGEIEKLIDENEMDGHPYEDLYNYIRKTNMETLRKNCIRRTLAVNTERVREHLETSFEKNCGKEVDFEMQPYLIKPYAKVVRKYSNQIGQIKTFDNYTNFEEMVEKIYKDVMNKINESPKLVEEEIEKLYSKIMIECSETLIGVKYKGQDLINTEKEPENSINKKAVKDLISRISDKDLEALYMLELSEVKKIKLGKKCLELSDEINNSQNVVYSYLLNLVQKKLKACETIIKDKLCENKNKHLLSRLKEDNIVEFKRNDEIIINLNLERLAEINIPVELFDFLNVRCRLKYAEEYLTSNIKNDYLEGIISGKIKIKDLKGYFEIPTFESMEPRNIKVLLDEVHRIYRKEKGREYNDATTKFAYTQNNSELFKTATIKDLEQDSDSNTIALRMPAPEGMISRRDALYIVKTLIAIEDNKEELNKFLNSDKVAKLPSNEENYILNSTRNLVYEHVTEDEKEKVKKLEKKGE